MKTLLICYALDPADEAKDMIGRPGILGRVPGWAEHRVAIIEAPSGYVYNGSRIGSDSGPPRVGDQVVPDVGWVYHDGTIESANAILGHHD